MANKVNALRRFLPQVYGLQIQCFVTIIYGQQSQCFATLITRGVQQSKYFATFITTGGGQQSKCCAIWTATVKWWCLTPNTINHCEVVVWTCYAISCDQPLWSVDLRCQYQLRSTTVKWWCGLVTTVNWCHIKYNEIWLTTVKWCHTKHDYPLWSGGVDLWCHMKYD